MDQKFSGILDELLAYRPARNQEAFIEAQGTQVIASALHLVRLIENSFSPEIAEDLKKRLVRSIMSGDQEKFCRRVRAIRESKQRPVG